jgi:hypothetical protein
VPTVRGFYFDGQAYGYVGSLRERERVPRGGHLISDFQSIVFCETLNLTYVPKATLGGANLGFVISLPICYLDGFSDQIDDNFGVVRRQTALGPSDVSVVPVQIGWHRGKQHLAALVTAYAPSGAYSTASLVPLGYNYWSLEPDLGYTYYDPKTGWEVSTFTGIDFNTTNQATHYHSGAQAHLDWNMALHLERGKTSGPGGTRTVRLPAGFALGLGGYVYQQVTGDSGSGATLGPFKARTLAVGPSAQNTYVILGQALTLQLRLQKEFDVENRLRGYASWLNISWGP